MTCVLFMTRPPVLSAGAIGRTAGEKAPSICGGAPSSAGRGRELSNAAGAGGQLTVLPLDLSACGHAGRHPALEGTGQISLSSIWAGRARGAPAARIWGARPATLVMPWRRWGRPRLGCLHHFLFAAVPRRSTGWTVLCARDSPAIRCQRSAAGTS